MARRSPTKCHIVVTHAGGGRYLVGIGVRKKYGRRVYRDAFWVKGKKMAKKLGERIARQQGCKRGTGFVQ